MIKALTPDATTSKTAAPPPAPASPKGGGPSGPRFVAPPSSEEATALAAAPPRVRGQTQLGGGAPARGPGPQAEQAGGPGRAFRAYVARQRALASFELPGLPEVATLPTGEATGASAPPPVTPSASTDPRDATQPVAEMASKAALAAKTEVAGETLAQAPVAVASKSGVAPVGTGKFPAAASVGGPAPGGGVVAEGDRLRLPAAGPASSGVAEAWAGATATAVRERAEAASLRERADAASTAAAESRQAAQERREAAAGYREADEPGRARRAESEAGEQAARASAREREMLRLRAEARDRQVRAEQALARASGLDAHLVRLPPEHVASAFRAVEREASRRPPGRPACRCARAVQEPYGA